MKPLLPDVSGLMTLIGALACVLLLMVALAWCARRSGWVQRFQRSQQSIHVLTSVSLGARAKVVLVDVGEDRFLLGVTASQITCLSREKVEGDA
ncbi:flagellar biosynthetic protein FliO [Pantoea sp. Acro-805]|uniref:Flagellar protein n=1 Tax=Candidatus Pantoea formicae TaxID=2608355 RepID=A0ABX0QXZ3_9GAMM|nr:flagellar biosynthetic protein FliO [Pantoea formicae]MDF7647160.1 flagellar biosynthetic protein FliO [Erwiniaceae bacterium L1_54_3]NIF01201.1 flagellar biosynthetic protein FliO [Pantoea formicae]